MSDTIVHGSPHDRGRADRYYGRPESPHKYPNGGLQYAGDNRPERVELTDPAEIAEYMRGYEEEEDRKEW